MNTLLVILLVWLIGGVLCVILSVWFIQTHEEELKDEIFGCIPPPVKWAVIFIMLFFGPLVLLLTVCVPLPEMLASGVHSYLVMPMIVGAELIGALSFGDTSAPLSPDHLGIAQEAATQVALALSQARLHEPVIPPPHRRRSPPRLPRAADSGAPPSAAPRRRPDSWGHPIRHRRPVVQSTQIEDEIAWTSLTWDTPRLRQRTCHVDRIDRRNRLPGPLHCQATYSVGPSAPLLPSTPE
jgi:hypothetical protein